MVSSMPEPKTTRMWGWENEKDKTVSEIYEAHRWWIRGVQKGDRAYVGDMRIRISQFQRSKSPPPEIKNEDSLVNHWRWLAKREWGYISRCCATDFSYPAINAWSPAHDTPLFTSNPACPIVNSQFKHSLRTRIWDALSFVGNQTSKIRPTQANRSLCGQPNTP
jgi:hypothetical protein